MELQQAIRTRRTHKAFGAEPVPRETLERLFELARWAPNHHLTNPWRFRVVGPATLERLKQIAESEKPGSASKLDRAPTLVVASAHGEGDAVQQQEDLIAASLATYVVLLGAHDEGLAGYWRTVTFLDSPAGRQALGMEGAERAIGLLHLGQPRQEQRVPERDPTPGYVSYLP
jgi:nitroreductase